MIGYASNQRALGAAPIAPEKMKIVGDAVYGKCDRADGVADGVIDDPRRCDFKPSGDLPVCADASDGPSCLTAAQIRTLETIYGSIKRSGADFFPGWPVGPEVGGLSPGPSGGVATGWMPWFIGPPNGRPIQINYGETFFRYMAFGRPNPSYDWMTFNLDADLDTLQWTRSVLDATDPDLSRFKARGAKIVSYYGWADPALNPMMGVNYYENVAKKLGPSTSDFYRMFMIPGMFHCGGGVGINAFDMFTPLVEWVEKGTAPQSIIGARVVQGKTLRTRPLCPYPEVAKYNGSGNIDDAANFSCAPQ